MYLNFTQFPPPRAKFSFFQLATTSYLCKSILCATNFGFTGTKLSYGVTNPSLEDKNDRNKRGLMR
jgi:hypothetical protein